MGSRFLGYNASMTKKDSAYIPGVCNINQEEIENRRKAGWAGGGLALALVATLFSFEAPWWWNVGAFPLFFAGVLGYLQAKNKFCVSYAAVGHQNASRDRADVWEIVDDKSKKLDQKRAQTINRQSAGVAALITAAFAGLAYFL